MREEDFPDILSHTVRSGLEEDVSRPVVPAEVPVRGIVMAWCIVECGILRFEELIVDAMDVTPALLLGQASTGLRIDLLLRLEGFSRKEWPSTIDAVRQQIALQNCLTTSERGVRWGNSQS